MESVTLKKTDRKDNAWYVFKMLCTQEILKGKRECKIALVSVKAVANNALEVQKVMIAI